MVMDIYGHMDESPGVKPTNQRAELYAIYTTMHNLEHIIAMSAPRRPPDAKVRIHLFTDSKYAIGCSTSWWQSWERNGWRKSDGSVPSNLELIQPTLNLLNSYQGIYEIKIYHVKAHSGIILNERADDLANQGALSEEPLVMVPLNVLM
jgi:ribonuclease HI